MKAKKSLGQNFLKDEFILNKISNSVEIKEKDLIIEIGPGTGALTKYLKEKNSYLICFEIDTRMKDILKKYENEKTKIIYEDILTTDIEKHLSAFDFENIYVIANIPYYITTPIIKKMMELKDLKSMTLLVQKEVAERFSAKPKRKAYGSITVYLNYYFNIKYLFNVKNTCFDPIPKVDSAVINFTKKENIPKVKEDTFFKLVEDAFKMKRKTLKNNLKEYNWESIKNVLANYNLEENVRAEELPLEVFINIANNI